MLECGRLAYTSKSIDRLLAVSHSIDSQEIWLRWKKVLRNDHFYVICSNSKYRAGNQAFMQRPVHPSHGRVKLNVDGCLFVWTGNFFFKFLCITVSNT